MKHSEMKNLMRNPMALHTFHTTGCYPKAKPAPSTPLRELIDSIPRIHWARYQGITLSPKLGFNCRIRFHSLSQLYTWLGGNAEIIRNSMPYQHRIIRSVKSVSMSDLIEHCSRVEGGK